MKLRARRSAAATASLPVVAKIACSAPGTMATRSSASSGSRECCDPKVRSRVELGRHRVAHDPRRMAEDQRPVAEGVVDVAPPVHVPEVGALAPIEVERMGPRTGPDGGRDTPRDDPTGGIEESLRARERRDGHGPRRFRASKRPVGETNLRRNLASAAVCMSRQVESS